MIAKPSIAFNDFAGTAKEVTARNVSGRNVLSSRAKHSKVVTPAQADQRNSLSKVSRAYKQLSDSQMRAWEILAGHLKGISTFGKAAEMTGHNAFVRLNSNREMVGLPALTEAPAYTADVPEVDYDDFWVTPTIIAFSGLEPPKDSYRLVVKMSGGQSVGISSGWSKTVIVAPGVQDDWGEALLTKLYTKTIGYSPDLGEKVFIELYWMDSDTGFVGETMRISAFCKNVSQIHGVEYVPRNNVTLDNLDYNPSMSRFDSFYYELASGSILVAMDSHMAYLSYLAGLECHIHDQPDTIPNGNAYFLARGYGHSQWAVGLIQNYIYIAERYDEFKFNRRVGGISNEFDVFGVSAFV